MGRGSVLKADVRADDMRSETELIACLIANLVRNGTPRRPSVISSSLYETTDPALGHLLRLWFGGFTLPFVGVARLLSAVSIKTGEDSVEEPDEA